MTRAVIEDAVAAVPDTFLVPLVSGVRALDRRRAAYVAFLWKRMREPRPFVEIRAVPGERGPGERPAWLRRRGAPPGA